jgi:ESF2/ABP1 family protein
VEFSRKRDAKAAVEVLNTRTIGGKKGGYYRDDVWSLKYLRGFKWGHLMAQVKNEEAERDGRMRAEGAGVRREMKEFLGMVERGRIEDTRKRKKEARGEVEEDDIRMDDGEEDSRKRRGKKDKNIKPVQKDTGKEDSQVAMTSKIF